jgi:hypothetical protein
LFKRVYHFGIGVGGLAYLGVGIGFILGTIFGGHFGSKLYNSVRFHHMKHRLAQYTPGAQLAARNGGQGKPEMRVPSIVIGALIAPIGLLYVVDFYQSSHFPSQLVSRSWYGWSAQTRTHWVMPIIGTGIFGFGAMLTLYVLLFIRGSQRRPPTFSLPIQLYLVDTFTYSASALSASAVRPSPQPLTFNPVSS